MDKVIIAYDDKKSQIAIICSEIKTYTLYSNKLAVGIV